MGRWLVVVALALALSGSGSVLNNPNLKPATPDVALALAEAAGLNPALRTAGQLSAPGVTFDPYKLRTHMSTSQSISAANQATPNWQLVTFDTVDYDTANDGVFGFNSTSHQYKVPIDGYYQINARVSSTRSTTTADYLAYGIALFRNGNELSRGAVDIRILKFSDGTITIMLSGATAPFTAVHADQVKLSRGDLIDIRVANFANSGDNLNTDTTVNFWTVALIST